MCKRQSKDGEDEKARLRSVSESLQSRLATKRRELAESENSATRLSEELAATTKELDGARQKNAVDDAMIRDLGQQIAMLQHEVRSFLGC